MREAPHQHQNQNQTSVRHRKGSSSVQCHENRTLFNFVPDLAQSGSDCTSGIHLVCSRYLAPTTIYETSPVSLLRPPWLQSGISVRGSLCWLREFAVGSRGHVSGRIESKWLVSNRPLCDEPARRQAPAVVLDVWHTLTSSAQRGSSRASSPSSTWPRRGTTCRKPFHPHPRKGD